MLLNNLKFVLEQFETNPNTMTHASVFSGIGGPEVAAVMLGWENLFDCEILSIAKSPVLDILRPN